MGADDGEDDEIAGGARRQWRQGRLRLLQGAERQAGIGMQDAPDRGEECIFARRRQQRDAEGQGADIGRAVMEGARHREAAQVEQVDEVRIRAEPAVEGDGIGQHVRDRVGGRRGRQQRNVDVLPHACGGAAQLFEPIEGGECVRRSDGSAGRNDFAGDRMQRVGVAFDQRAAWKRSATHGPS